MQNNSASLLLKPINVRLCGSIPRKDLIDDKEQAGAPCCRSRSSPFATTANGPTPTTLGVPVVEHELIVVDQQQQPLTMTSCVDFKPLCPVLEPPAWAVPAQGETRLEPVCDSTGRQMPVDLTKHACVRVGRSPSADVQLMHATSSRRHAMLFHHENGCCYIVDCGSAHGTYLNGRRISSPSANGVAVPHKVRRGMLVRFGGPGAPCFILKSFSFQLNEIEGSVPTPDMGELVRRNTRINALGGSASERIHSQLAATIEAAIIVTRKRSFDSLDSRETCDEIPCDKRMRCSSPELSPLSPLRLVSPDLPPPLTCDKVHQKRVTFSTNAPQLFYASLVTPEDELSGTEEE